MFVIADVESFEEYLRVELDAWYPDLEPAQQFPSAVVERPDPRWVMVVHGRDLAARDDLFNLLRALGLKPIEWDEAVRATETGTPYTGEAVDAAFRIAQAAVVLCTPDEQVLLREDLRDPNEPAEARVAWQPRPRASNSSRDFVRFTLEVVRRSDLGWTRRLGGVLGPTAAR